MTENNNEFCQGNHRDSEIKPSSDNGVQKEGVSPSSEVQGNGETLATPPDVTVSADNKICGKCFRGTVKTSNEHKIVSLHDCWLRLSLFLRRIYRSVLDDEAPPTDYEDYMELVKELCISDPEQLFARLESELQEYVIEVKLRQLELVNSIHTPDGPKMFVFCLMDAYNKLLFAAYKLAPVLHQLEVDMLSRFKLSWRIYNEHLYHKHVYNEPEIHEVLPYCIAKLGQLTECQDFNRKICRQFLKFADDMAAIGNKWREVEDAMMKYNQESAGAKQRVMKVNWELIKCQRKVLWDEIKSSGISSSDTEPDVVSCSASLKSTDEYRTCFCASNITTNLDKSTYCQNPITEHYRKMRYMDYMPTLENCDYCRSAQNHEPIDNGWRLKNDIPLFTGPFMNEELLTFLRDESALLHNTNNHRNHRSSTPVNNGQRSRPDNESTTISPAIATTTSPISSATAPQQSQNTQKKKTTSHTSKQKGSDNKDKSTIDRNHHKEQRPPTPMPDTSQQPQQEQQNPSSSNQPNPPPSKQQRPSDQQQQSSSVPSSPSNQQCMSSANQQNQSLPNQQPSPQPQPSTQQSSTQTQTRPQKCKGMSNKCQHSAKISIRPSKGGPQCKTSTVSLPPCNHVKRNLVNGHMRGHQLPDVVKSSAGIPICAKHADAGKRMMVCHDHEHSICSGSDQSGGDEESGSDVSSPQRHCDCCYCEVFGHGGPQGAPVSRNYQEMRERLRTLLTKKKEQKLDKNGQHELAIMSENMKYEEGIDSDDTESTGTVSKRKQQTNFEYQGDKPLNEILNFIEGNKGRNQKRAAKQARRKQRQVEEEEERIRLAEEERKRLEELRRKEEEETKRKLEEERRKQEILKEQSRRKKKKNAKQIKEQQQQQQQLLQLPSTARNKKKKRQQIQQLQQQQINQNLSEPQFKKSQNKSQLITTQVKESKKMKNQKPLEQIVTKQVPTVKQEVPKQTQSQKKQKPTNQQHIVVKQAQQTVAKQDMHVQQKGKKSQEKQTHKQQPQQIQANIKQQTNVKQQQQQQQQQKQGNQKKPKQQPQMSNQQKNYSAIQNGTNSSQPKMVTIKRVMEPHSSEPTVTITLRGETPNDDKVLYTLQNGQMCNNSKKKNNKQKQQQQQHQQQQHQQQQMYQQQQQQMYQQQQQQMYQQQQQQMYQQQQQQMYQQQMYQQQQYQRMQPMGPSSNIINIKSCTTNQNTRKLVNGDCVKITDRLGNLSLGSELSVDSGKRMGATPSELTTPTAIQINQAVNQLSSRLNNKDFNFEDIKLPPGITITKVDPSKVQQRKPIQVKQQQQPPQQHHPIQQTIVTSPVAPSNIIVVDTGDKGFYQNDMNGDGKKKRRRRKKENATEINGNPMMVPLGISNPMAMPNPIGMPNSLGISNSMSMPNPLSMPNPMNMSSPYSSRIIGPPSGLPASSLLNGTTDFRNTQQPPAIIKMNGSMVTIRNPMLHNTFGGQTTFEVQDPTNRTRGAISRDLTTDEVYAARSEEVAVNHYDEYEQEIEQFKIFCSQSVPAESKAKVKLNLDNIVLKKKAAAVISCS